MQTVRLRNTHGISEDLAVVWANREDAPIIIIDGKIEFYDPNLGCGFSLYVKGTKGLGSSDADKLIGKPLSEKHRYMLEVFKKGGWDSYTSEQALHFAAQYWTGKGVFKSNPFKRIISELFRRKLLAMDNQNPPHYSLIEDRVAKALESGIFED